MKTATCLDFYTAGGYYARKPEGDAAHSEWKAGKIAQLIQKHSLNLGSVCEIGCGAGEILAALQRLLPKKIRFHGYEVAPAIIAVCNTKANDRLQFTLTEDFLADGARYDLALAIDVFEHVEDYLGFIRKLARKAPYVIFHIPLDMSVLNILLSRRIMQMRKDIGHIHSFMKDTALATLKDAGYEILDHHYTAAGLDCPTGTLRNRFANLFRRALFAIAPDFTARTLGGYAYMVLAKSGSEGRL